MKERLHIRIAGTVQGVGFRPFVYRVATQLQLAGSVRNSRGEVLIEAEGRAEQLAQLLDELVHQAPPLARIERLESTPATLHHDAQFRIDTSEEDGDRAPANEQHNIHVSPDVATCADCLREMRDPENRRCHFPFLNCTNCGPRLTIVCAAPYDRERTTMRSFTMCDSCRAEFENPRDRRFHAQPIACPACGPQVSLCNAAGAAFEVEDPIAEFARALLAGSIGALKGIGGFHLVCDAANAAAVAELRRRKHRDDKPFAVMLPDTARAQQWCIIGDAERELLESWRRPIVLLQRRPLGNNDGHAIAEGVAPGNPDLGVMLPYSPLHDLLMDCVNGRPLVMTSGNRSDEPIAIDNGDALQRLRGVADLFLMHDRPIRVRCDDSVTRIVSRTELPIRRSRGYAPQPIELPMSCTVPLVAVGGQLKGTFALGHGSEAIVSHHLGDLDHLEAWRAFERDLALYVDLFRIRPECIVHDLHPDYASTRYARQRAADEGLDLLGVQHHHAHMASCMAEHGLTGPVIGVTFDGTGYGTDGAIWGGEFLVGDYGGFRRAGHLRYVQMPGGDQAIREPWRMAAACLSDAGCGDESLRDWISAIELRTIGQMLERELNAPRTSSAGRLFDAVAAIAGVQTHVRYEGQAAMRLEWLARESNDGGVYPFEIGESGDAGPDVGQGGCVVDTRPLIAAVAGDAGRIAAAVIARRLHNTIADLIAEVCGRIRDETGVNIVVLSGGVFLNALLTAEAVKRLEDRGFDARRHHRVPPNDGGLSLGQIAIAAWQSSKVNNQAKQPTEIQTCAWEYPAV